MYCLGGVDAIPEEIAVRLLACKGGNVRRDAGCGDVAQAEVGRLADHARHFAADIQLCNLYAGQIAEGC